MVYLAIVSSSGTICFVSSCTLTPRFLKICDTRYDISCSCYTSIIQKNACLYNKIHIKFLPPSAYVIVEQNRICGVFAFFTGIEPTYQLIENGTWQNDAPYGTVHRIAGNGQCKGILAETLSFCEKQINNIRIDTHDDNKIMQHLLAKYGYQKCGYIYVEDGSRRIAYQKVVGTSSTEETYPLFFGVD